MSAEETLYPSVVEMAPDNRTTLVSLVRQLETTRGSAVALAEAARWSLLDEVDRLLASGVSPNVRLEGGGTPLMCAGTKKSCHRLLKAGADPNATDGEGRTPLIWMMKGLLKKHEAVVRIRLLLDYGANPGIRDNLGMTAFDHAAGKYDHEVTDMLK